MLSKKMRARPAAGRSGVLLACLLSLGALVLGGCPSISDPDDYRGTIRVTPAPESLNAPWIVKTGFGPEAEFYVSGSGADTLLYCGVGPYSIQWGPVDGYWEPTPNPAEAQLEQGAQVFFNGTYTPRPGEIVVDPEPGEIHAPWVLSGPGGVEQSGDGDSYLNSMEHGEYSNDWGDVEGYVTPSPDPTTGALVPGGQLVLQGTYMVE